MSDSSDDEQPAEGEDKRRAAKETLLPTLTLSVLGGVAPDAEATPLPASLTPMPAAALIAPVQEDSTTSKPRGARRGDVIGGRYVVDGQIGRGGMGRVLRVRHQVLGKAFALKLIKVPIASNPRIREMFYREARLASALSHDNICSIVDFGQDPTFGLFMVMELLEGKTMHHKLRQDGGLAPKVACDVMWQIAEACRYIHGRAIIHGDIKSENILLTRTPDRRRVVKLLDFGLARAGVPTGSGKQVEGTPEYLAPERIRGAPASPASDIYALGIVFFELLTGRQPFAGSVEEVFAAHLRAPMPRPTAHLKEAIDERVDDIVLRATAKAPDDRHPDVAGFLYELRTLMNMLGMDLGRRRASGGGTTSRKRAATDHRAVAAGEVFDNAPVPLASVDGDGNVRVANQAFLEFLGAAGGAVGLNLGDSGLLEVYPALLGDIKCAVAGRTTIKRVIYLREGGGHLIEVAVVMTPAPGESLVTAGEIHLALHPLGRVSTRPG